jgi:hypothetical protein
MGAWECCVRATGQKHGRQETSLYLYWFGLFLFSFSLYFFYYGFILDMDSRDNWDIEDDVLTWEKIEAHQDNDEGIDGRKVTDCSSNQIWNKITIQETEKNQWRIRCNRILYTLELDPYLDRHELSQARLISLGRILRFKGHDSIRLGISDSVSIIARHKAVLTHMTTDHTNPDRRHNPLSGS